MDSRPEWERTVTADGEPLVAVTPTDQDDDVVVLPETTVLRSTRRPINWGAPHPDQRLEQARPLPPLRLRRSGRTLRHRFLTGVMILSFTVMALAIVAAAADWGTRNYEMDAILDEIEVSEGIMLDAKERVSELIQSSPNAASGDSEASREELQRIAAEASSALSASAGRIAAVRLLPWHDGVAVARSAYLSHSAAWQKYLSAAAGDATQWFELYPQIDLTWELLAPHLRSAVPSPSIWELEGRVDTILGGSEPEPGPTPLDA